MLRHMAERVRSDLERQRRERLVGRRVADAIYLLLAALPWLIPDRRIERSYPRSLKPSAGMTRHERVDARRGRLLA